MIEIQHGVIKSNKEANLYFYVQVSTYAHSEDYQSPLEVKLKDEVVIFSAKEGEVPEIGDFIDGGVLVKRTQPKVNNDWSKWKDKDL